MLGTGFIARYYANALLGHRRMDKIVNVYSRNEEHAKEFANQYGSLKWTTNMEEAISDKDVDIVCIALPNNLHEQAVLLCCKHKKGVMITKPLGRNSIEAKNMLKAVEEAGIFNGYLEDTVYSPKFLKANEKIQQGGIGKVLWAKSRETHNGPHSSWFWDVSLAGGGCLLDLGCHCVELIRSYIGKGIKPLEVMCWADTQLKPIDAEDHAIGLIRFENGAIGQFEVSWIFRGGMDVRDEITGSEGTIWINNAMRTGIEIFSTVTGNNYVAEKTELSTGWLFPQGDELNDFGYYNMFTDIMEAFNSGRAPVETFYDGYVVNEILDAAYRSAKSGMWEPVALSPWRGATGSVMEKEYVEFDNDHFLIKEEITHGGKRKVIIMNKHTRQLRDHII